MDGAGTHAVAECRAFSKFQEDGLLEVRQRHVRVLDPAALQLLVDGTPPDAPDIVNRRAAAG